jgi:hypothetical protein
VTEVLAAFHFGMNGQAGQLRLSRELITLVFKSHHHLKVKTVMKNFSAL